MRLLLLHLQDEPLRLEDTTRILFGSDALAVFVSMEIPTLCFANVRLFPGCRRQIVDFREVLKERFAMGKKESHFTLLWELWRDSIDRIFVER